MRHAGIFRPPGIVLCANDRWTESVSVSVTPLTRRRRVQSRKDSETASPYAPGSGQLTARIDPTKRPIIEDRPAGLATRRPRARSAGVATQGVNMHPMRPSGAKAVLPLFVLMLVSPAEAELIRPEHAPSGPEIVGAIAGVQ